MEWNNEKIQIAEKMIKSYEGVIRTMSDEFDIHVLISWHVKVILKLATHSYIISDKLNLNFVANAVFYTE